MRWRDPSLRWAAFGMTAQCGSFRGVRVVLEPALGGLWLCLPSRFGSLSIASAPFRKEPLGRHRRLSPMSHMISGESAPGFLIQFPLKACRLFYQIHAPQSALDAQITQEGVSRNRNVDSIFEKIANSFRPPPDQTEGGRVRGMSNEANLARFRAENGGQDGEQGHFRRGRIAASLRSSQ